MFEGFYDYLEEEPEKENTENIRRRGLQEFYNWLEGEGIEDIDDVRRRHIYQYVDHLVDEGYAKSTIVRAKYSSISAVFNWLYDERYINENPVDRVKYKKIRKKADKTKSIDEKKREMEEIDHLTKDEVYELAENAVSWPQRDELIIKFLFWTGIRVSELVHINIGDDGTLDGPNSDIDINEPKVQVYGKKTDDGRVVSYHRKELNPLLRDWVSHGRLRFKCADSTNRLFIGPKGPLTESGVKRLVDKAARNADMQEVKRVSKDGREYHRVTPHLLRHSHSMHYRNVEGVSFDDLKGHLGHSSVDTTEEYYAESNEERMVDVFGE